MSYIFIIINDGNGFEIFGARRNIIEKEICILARPALFREMACAHGDVTLMTVVRRVGRARLC